MKKNVAKTYEPENLTVPTSLLCTVFRSYVENITGEYYEQQQQFAEEAEYDEAGEEFDELGARRNVFWRLVSLLEDEFALDNVTMTLSEIHEKKESSVLLWINFLYNGVSLLQWGEPKRRQGISLPGEFMASDTIADVVYNYDELAKKLDAGKPAKYLTSEYAKKSDLEVKVVEPEDGAAKTLEFSRKVKATT